MIMRCSDPNNVRPNNINTHKPTEAPLQHKTAIDRFTPSLFDIEARNTVPQHHISSSAYKGNTTGGGKSVSGVLRFVVKGVAPGFSAYWSCSHSDSPSVPRFLLTIRISAPDRFSSVPYALGFSRISVCSGTSTHRPIACPTFWKSA